MTLLKKKGGLSVNYILEFFEITQATLSSHLAVLRKANLVKVNTKGKQRIYEINMRLINNFINKLNKFGSGSGNNFERDIVVRKKTG